MTIDTREFQIEPVKTYASKENARKAVMRARLENVRHFLMPTDDGRWFPVFIGQAALDRGAHFHFNVVG